MADSDSARENVLASFDAAFASDLGTQAVARALHIIIAEATIPSQ